MSEREGSFTDTRQLSGEVKSYSGAPEPRPSNSDRSVLIAASCTGNTANTRTGDKNASQNSAVTAARPQTKPTSNRAATHCASGGPLRIHHSHTPRTSTRLHPMKGLLTKRYGVVLGFQSTTSPQLCSKRIAASMTTTASKTAEPR